MDGACPERSDLRYAILDMRRENGWSLNASQKVLIYGIAYLS